MGNESLSRYFELTDWPLIPFKGPELKDMIFEIDKITFSFGTMPQQTLVNEDDFIKECDGSTLQFTEKIQVD
ncbi:MAG: hypothetical protein JXA43_00975 [Candidatus Diapherotrites archaeon]|nr:hypothetical protein [Candidatus Diapherotrites archaeon]